MEIFATFIDIVLHLDVHLAALLVQYGAWVYLILFVIIFCETGLVVTPFLPGDSLLFVVGALAGTGGLEIELIIPLLIGAALFGDNVNYFVGRAVGSRVFQWQQSRFFNKAAFDRTHAFYERHGGKTIIIARFLPLVRTFAPFVAGIARMTYTSYLTFCVLGAVLWVGSLCLAGYWFGNLPLIKENLTLMILAIIMVSLLPLIIGYWRQRAAAKTPPPAS
ncbi:MAG TPA: DedA family protein [Gammaproteobacteria bacterium]